MLQALAVVLTLLLQTQVPAVPQQQVAKGSIEGVVLSSVSAEPLDRARVTLTRMLPPPSGPVTGPITPPPPVAPAQTEKDGKFSFKDLEPGQYRLRVQRNGYSAQEYGQRTPTSPGTVINLTEGQQIKNMEFRLIAAAVITGRVRDSNGEPVPSFQVSLMRTTYNVTGQRSLTVVGNTNTDDRGEYRIFWVPPGRYLLSVRGGAVGPSVIMLNDGGQIISVGSQNVFPDRTFPVTYYPGTLDPSRASTLDLQPGAELSAVDVVLTQPVSYQIRGRLVDPSNPKPPQSAGISMVPRQEQGSTGITFATGMQQSATYNNTNGTFEIKNVIPGSYWLRASISTDLNQPLDQAVNLTAANTARTAMELLDTVMLSRARSAQIQLEVAGSDINNVALVLSPSISVPMRVQFEGQEVSSVAGLDRVRVNLRPTVVGAPTSFQTISFNAEGTAVLANLSPGEYRVSVSAPSPDMYLKEVLFDRQDVLTQPWEISSQTSGTLNIVFSNKSGLIEGSLVDVLSQPVRGNQVVLIPDLMRDRPDLYKTATTDQNGRFTFRGVPPGGYRVYAWEIIEANAWYDREILSRYENQGRPVRMQESGKESVDLKIIPAPK